ncbi:stalk domain-containing protein [Mesobacillus jeotgali]|uniref:stalk domain-containing protein n=1 Tax=Mesobacillus jeotgali TaxID=129985 RepID=UPI000C844914|nr:stalk domain-containing protein [Mesobacillus jeotgali]
MKKVSFLLTTGLFIIICVAVIWQWSAFQQKNDKPSKSEGDISLIVSVKVEQDELQVKQTFDNLKMNQQYHAIIPAQAIEVNCTDAEGDTCKEEHKPKGNKMHFEYTIKSGPGLSILLNDWMIVLKDAEIKKTRIEIVDQYYKRGTWSAGIPLKGYKQTELLHYYVFEGENSTPSLYWQEKPLIKLTGQKGIDYYTTQKEQVIYKFDSLETFSDNHISVVIIDGKRAVRGNGILLAGNELTDKEFEHGLAVAFLSSKFGTDEEAEGWILEALASLVTKQVPENEKSRAMVEELEKNLTPEEIAAFVTYYSKQGHLNGNSIDGYLSSIKGMESDFFTMNSQKRPGIFPLLFTDARSVIVNGDKKEELAAVIKGGQYLFPLVPTMNALGYETTLGPDLSTLEISSANHTYYFNLKNKTFIHGGQTFGLLENPFQNLNGDLYMGKHWLNAIFKVQVSESEESITLGL